MRIPDYDILYTFGPLEVIKSTILLIITMRCLKYLLVRNDLYTGCLRSKRKSLLCFTYICIGKVAWLFAVTYGAHVRSISVEFIHFWLDTNDIPFSYWMHNILLLEYWKYLLRTCLCAHRSTKQSALGEYTKQIIKNRITKKNLPNVKKDLGASGLK